MNKLLSRILNPVTQLCDIRQVGHSHENPYTMMTDYHCLTHDCEFSVQMMMTKPLLCDKALGLKE